MTDWSTLLSFSIQTFLRDHENADVRDLALRKPPDAAWNYPLILDQIKARQKAKVKMPQWLEVKELIFPTGDIVEQASSSATAIYKSQLFSGDHFVDLTCGCGIDSWAILDHFQHGTAIDADANNIEIFNRNIQLLSKKSMQCIQSKAEDFVPNMDQTDLIMIDPQRRDDHKKGKYRLEDCSPNIVDLLPVLKNKAKTILLKTSPMLDIDQTIEALSGISQIHVLEYQGECKEVLYVIDDAPEEPKITAVCLDDQKALSFTRTQEKQAKTNLSKPLKYIYEPGPAFMKAGCFQTLCETYGVAKLHPHTHLYTSDAPVPAFPGRSFEIQGSYPVQAKALPFRKANLSIRNFPSDVKSLKKKLKLQDGGEDYLFACTLEDESFSLIHVKKIKF